VGVVSAQNSNSSAVADNGRPNRITLLDHEFGVSTRQLGLQRRVQMYQWLRKGGGYAPGWHDALVDSSDFDPRFANPDVFPLQTRYWIGQGITFEGKPLDENVLKVLGRWRQFRPGFTALPGNLSATFQPDGDGLSSSENPLDPQIGDLRVTWHELTLPALTDQVTMQNGVWVLAQAGSKRADAMPTQAPIGRARSDPGARSWLFWVVVALLLAWLLGRILSRLLHRRP